MRCCAFFLVVGLIVCTVVFADVPKLMNFQGRLTDASGKFVTDGNYPLTFRIYTDSTGGNAKWFEIQSVTVSKGLFNAILGSVNPIPDSIFSYANTWLGIQVLTDPEMTPRQRLSSLGYSYRTVKADTSSYSMNSDKLDGLHATDFTSPASDYGRFGVATDLYEGTSTLTDKYVNTIGPDSVYSTSGIAFKASVSGSNTSSLYGIQGYAENTSTGLAYGGFFTTSSSGAGAHYGLMARGYGGASDTTFGSYSFASNTSSGTVFGAYGFGNNSSSGEAYGGKFLASDAGTGIHYGVDGNAFSSSSNPAYGAWAYASNNSTGDAYGGFFDAGSTGTGWHYGVVGVALGSSSNYTMGVKGYAACTSTGYVFGGWFYADSMGTGPKWGIWAHAPLVPNSYAAVFDGNTYTTGSKSAAVKVDNGEYHLLYSQESPENWFEDFGEGQLASGKAHIELDPLFLQTVTIDNVHSMKVFIQLTSGNPMNVVVNKGTTGFDVVASDNISNATFDYRVVAKRKGYEDVRLAKILRLTPEEIVKELAKTH